MYIQKQIVAVILLFIIALNTVHPLPSFAEADDDRPVSEMIADQNENEQEKKNTEEKTMTEQTGGNVGQDNEETSLTEGEQYRSGEEVPLMEERSLFSVFAQMFVALLFVLLIMYGLLRFIKKRTRTFQSHRTMQNLGGVTLGNHRSIQLVKVGNRLLVVGVGDSIQLLKEIENEEEMEQLMSNHDIQGEDVVSKASNWVTEKWRRKSGSDDHSSFTFKHVLDNRLKEIKHERKQITDRLKE